MDVMAGLAALGQAINIAKFVREADHALQGAELKAKLTELYDKLADARMALLDARDELAANNTEIVRLGEALKFKAEKTARINGLVYELEEGRPVVYPFCPKCEASHQFFRLLRTQNLY
jgi:hypothetical protein